MEPTRRGFVGAAALAVGLPAGCLGDWNSDVADIYIYNRREQSVSGTVTATRNADGGTVLEQRFELAPSGQEDDSRTYDDSTITERVRVEVTVDGGPTGAHDFDGGPGTGLSIAIREGAVEFRVGET